MSKINKKICNYIASEWISKAKSNRVFALDHTIDEKTVRKILQPEGYRIPFVTITRICDAREIKISDFFILLDL